MRAAVGTAAHPSLSSPRCSALGRSPMRRSRSERFTPLTYQNYTLAFFLLDKRILLTLSLFCKNKTVFEYFIWRVGIWESRLNVFRACYS